MPLQNRVDPFGNLFAAPARGLLMGNRGGRLHRDDRSIGTRRWASRQWICCRLAFNDRRRTVWGDGYTELFFLDEVTALAAGHRPCFECRRREAQTFAECWQRGSCLHERPNAAAMDRVLHEQRLAGRRKALHCRPIDEIPDGAVVAIDGAAFAVRGEMLLRWTPVGYGSVVPRPSGQLMDVLTPSAILAALKAGYRPLWHPSANDPRST
jgi:hypothetical protein